MTKKVLILIAFIIVAGLIWYFGSPLFIDKTIDEGFPEIPTEEEMEDMTREQVMEIERDIVEKMSERPDEVVNEEMMKEPEILYSGMFRDGDNFHKGEGDAGIYELPDGSKILRLENFSVTNGPALYVLLAEDQNPEDSSDVQDGYIELAKLKGNKGDQNYEMDKNIDLSNYKSIVIYCKPFHVVFSVASLESN